MMPVMIHRVFIYLMTGRGDPFAGLSNKVLQAEVGQQEVSG
jgi:hypothetical protein